MTDKAMELGKDVIVGIAWDSFKAAKITFDKQRLVERAISHGIYIFFFEKMMYMTIQRSGVEHTIAKLFSGLVGKSVIDMIVTLIMKRQINYTDILVSNAMSETIGLAWDSFIGESRHMKKPHIVKVRAF